MNEKIEDVKSLADVRKIDAQWTETFGRWWAFKMLVETAYANEGVIAECRKKFDANAKCPNGSDSVSISFDDMLASVLGELEERHDASTEARMKAHEWICAVKEDDSYGRYEIHPADGYLVRNDAKDNWVLYQHSEPRYIQECVDEYRHVVQFRGNECLASTSKTRAEAVEEMKSISDWQTADKSAA